LLKQIDRDTQKHR
jgi:hypothetical protein